MKREIKFRAMTKANNVMVFGDVIVCPNGEHRMLWFELKGENSLDLDYDSFNEVVQTSTIGQFTGLKDKNGIEIYEDDILKDVHFGYNTKVVYSGNQFVSESNVGNVGLFETENYEVIGNIFQNPDLLQSS